jgi:hypothetical protein
MFLIIHIELSGLQHIHPLFQVFATFAELVLIFLSPCFELLSVCMQLKNNWTDFHEILY